VSLPPGGERLRRRFGSCSRANFGPELGCNLMEQAVLEGVIAVRAALHARSRELHRILIRDDKDDRPVTQLEQRARASGIVVERVPTEAIDAVASGTTHGGVVALAGPRRFAALDKLGAGEKAPFLALLDGIEDPFNFGYALRSLYAAGAHGAVLGPRNWMAAAGTVARASAGASELLPLAVAEPLEAVEQCAGRGLTVVCAAAEREAQPLFDADLRRSLLLVVGGERRGISRSVLARADLVVRIPYGRDFRGSLGTTAAAAVLAFEVLRQRRSTPGLT
jgi:23S rRNA (guanosine2251-2'-O)-methyltransferase